MFDNFPFIRYHKGMRRYAFSYLPPSFSFSDFAQSKGKGLPSLSIDNDNWKVGSRLPHASCRGGWNETGLFLLFSVTESESLRRYTRVNDPVWNDSCVEFFIRPDPDRPSYCNFEFNSLGAFLSQQGEGRSPRLPISEAEAALVQRLPDFRVESTDPYRARWTLAVFLPASLLQARSIALLPGATYRANFYKCGDGLADPHFLSWNPIQCEQPDFHRPEFFGIIGLNPPKESSC